MPKRPFSVTLLLLLVLFLSVWGSTRLAAALRWWDILTEFKAGLSPLYLSITGTGWGVAGCVLLFGISRRKAWTRQAVFAFILLWLIEYWTERVLFEAARANLPFAFSSSILIFTVVWIANYQRSTILFFSKSEEHEQPFENPNPE